MRQFITTELLILVMWSGPLRGLLGPPLRTRVCECVCVYDQEHVHMYVCVCVCVCVCCVCVSSF